MKKQMLMLVVLTGMMLVQGCRVVWYKPGTTLNQSVQDAKECFYDAHKSSWDEARLVNLCRQCMNIRGYTEFDSFDQLPQGTRWQDIGVIPPFVFLAAGD